MEQEQAGTGELANKALMPQAKLLRQLADTKRSRLERQGRGGRYSQPSKTTDLLHSQFRPLQAQYYEL
jgi:hypothetical protein